ncbi:MAG: SH3 domain-containing protein [Acidimicrobiia bacterium]|nr:SH3 domain-containing protein [Acidimicrobiia bacterium]
MASRAASARCTLTATAQVSGANVRQGPDADRYDAIASLEAGAKVVVLGTNEARDWVKVLVPFSEIDFPYRGVEGWMAAFLFGTAEDGSSLDLNALSVIETEGEAAANQRPHRPYRSLTGARSARLIAVRACWLKRYATDSRGIRFF